VRWHEWWPGWGWADRRRPGHSERATLASVAAALAVVFGEGLLDYPLRNAVLASTVWLLVGLLAAATRASTARWGDRSEPDRFRRGARVEAAAGSQWPYPVESVRITDHSDASRRLDA
jgi:hypothetical protein